MTVTVGLDVGGAHLKVARLEAGQLADVQQFASPLWKGFDRLGSALSAAMPMLTGAKRVAVTMTGELSDLFENRAMGVIAIVSFLDQAFGPAAHFYLGQGGFGSAEEAKADPAQVGSMNFLATAEAVGGHTADALLIDFGSTTVDIIPIQGGRPSVRGTSDVERQATSELVYTGYSRTAVMGVATSAPLKGRWVGLAREHLATMGDVRRVLGEDLSSVDLHTTADGRGHSREESLARLARMFGCDAAQHSDGDWRIAAAFLRDRQLQSICEGAFLVLSAAELPQNAPVIAAGIGADDVLEIARRLERPGLTFGQQLGFLGNQAVIATHHAPAVATAVLLSRLGFPAS